MMAKAQASSRAHARPLEQFRELVERWRASADQREQIAKAATNSHDILVSTMMEEMYRACARDLERAIERAEEDANR